MNLSRLSTLIAKETREILRDRVYLMLAFLLPVMLMLVFAYGMTWDIEHIGFVVIDEDQTAASRAYAQHFLSTEHFDRLTAATDARSADAALTDGRAKVVLWIGPHFERDLSAGRTVDVQVQIDGAFPAPARTIRGYVEAINEQANAVLRVEALQAYAGAHAARLAQLAEPVRLQTRFLYNPEVRSVVMVAPSMMMLILILVPPLLIAVSVVREKETGSIFNIASSTATRLEYLLGKLLPVVAISLFDGVVMWLLSIFWFGVPFRGGALSFVVLLLLYVCTTSGLGLLI